MKRCVPLAIAGSCVALAVTIAGCSPKGYTGALAVPPGRPLKAQALSVPSPSLTAAIDDFGLDLLEATTKGEKGNVIVSPLSVHAALSMTANGADGETRKQMLAVLHTASMTRDEANHEWASLLAGLDTRAPEQTLEIANSLWARKGVPFKQPFIDADRDFFGAQLATLDFAKDDVAGAINGWVSRNTHRMITNMVEKAPSNAVLYLANAVYFKGEWVSPFTHEATAQGQFTRADGSKVSVDMMHKTDRLPYAENGALQATRLMYKGVDTGFYVLLPKEGVDTGTAMDSLRGTGFSTLRATLMSPNSTEVVLGLPKLETDFGTELSGALRSMGMPRAFDDVRAEFLDMADLGPDQPIYISKVIHKTKVKVDEKGTEAAAATVVEMVGGAAPNPVTPPRIICDRPYLLAMVDEKSGAMLFLGLVNDPTK